MFFLMQDGQVQYGPATYNDCLLWLQEQVSYSWSHAMNHEGWTIEPEDEGGQPILHLTTLEPSCRMFIAPSVIPGDPGRGRGRGGSWGLMIQNLLDPNVEREPFAEEAFIVQAVAPLLCMEHGGLSWPIRLLESQQIVPAGILLTQATLRLWDDRSQYAAELWDMMNEGLYAPHMRRASRSEL